MPTLLDQLAAMFPTAKRTTLRRMIDERRVTVNGLPAAKANVAVNTGDKVEVSARGPAKNERATVVPEIDIVHEDADLLVVNKPPGVLTSTTPTEPRPTLWAQVQRYLAASSPAARPGLIHRLDREARGLLVFSKSDVAYRSLKTQFFHHSVERGYIAVCAGVPTPRAGRVDLALVERADGTVRPARKPGEGERAVTDYETVGAHGGFCIVRLTLHTGRKHQIRVHLAHRGAAIVGDPLYAPAPHDVPPLHLAAVRLGLAHPRGGRPVRFELPVPPEFAARLG